MEPFITRDAPSMDGDWREELRVKSLRRKRYYRIIRPINDALAAMGLPRVDPIRGYLYRITAPGTFVVVARLPFRLKIDI